MGASWETRTAEAWGCQVVGTLAFRGASLQTWLKPNTVLLCVQGGQEGLAEGRGFWPGG